MGRPAEEAGPSDGEPLGTAGRFTHIGLVNAIPAPSIGPNGATPPESTRRIVVANSAMIPRHPAVFSRVLCLRSPQPLADTRL
ncbi:hypothetical protein [Actinoallomurus rhizosphaericola]|uniref:hypothetical protein n=1 Tax=Actinoallomurus rhizosphaericola TaxID=2952536 RepID=UPI0020936916|nr:hypothetical protein [Actinoallomurus rhizosphaericola]MCO5998326.1 hypothetical protein [Actinoallomurus rhizosphaericola]